MLDRVQARPVGGGGNVTVPTAASEQPAVSFAEVLAAEGIKLSAHAQQRLDQAGATPDPTRFKSAVEKAEAKGSKESLVMLDDLAFIVSVKNKTVITAVDQGRAKDNVFTNIDSVVIA